jgi:hypothetical protein
MTGASLSDYCRRRAEALEGDAEIVRSTAAANDHPKDNDLLHIAQDIDFIVGQRGHIKEVRVTTDVGGPNLTVLCFSGVIKGSWSMETYRCQVDSGQVEAFGERFADEMERRID